MYESHPVRSFLMELLNAFATLLLWLFKAVKVAVMLFFWIIVIGGVITKNR